MSDSSDEAIKNAAERSLSRKRKSGHLKQRATQTLFDLKRKDLANDLFKSQRMDLPPVSPNSKLRKSHQLDKQQHPQIVSSASKQGLE